MAHILKFWHQWSWLFHLGVWLAASTAAIATYQSSIAQTARDVAALQSEKLPERMAVQENSTKDVRAQLDRMETVQGKIFERINQIGDRRDR